MPGEDGLVQEHEEITARMRQDSLVMKNCPAMAPIKFDMYNFTSSRVTEFDMTSTIKGMNENRVKVTMLSATSEFAPEAALVRVNKQKGETVYHRNMCRLLKR